MRLHSEGGDIVHPRLEIDKVAPEALEAVLQVSAYINNHSGLELTLLNLVYLRASQINGCAWCIDRHTKDARALGETACTRKRRTFHRQGTCEPDLGHYSDQRLEPVQGRFSERCRILPAECSRIKEEERIVDSPGVGRVWRRSWEAVTAVTGVAT